MLAGTIIFEDHTLHFHYARENWHIVICDNLTGRELSASWSDEELSSILSLMFDEDNATKRTWSVAEKAEGQKSGSPFRLIP